MVFCSIDEQKGVGLPSCGIGLSEHVKSFFICEYLHEAIVVDDVVEVGIDSSVMFEVEQSEDVAASDIAELELKVFLAQFQPIGLSQKFVWKGNPF